MEITTLGAFIALGVAIFLIIKGIPAVYGMIIGALLGGITSGLNIFETVNIMINGASGMSSALSYYNSWSTCWSAYGIWSCWKNR